MLMDHAILLPLYIYPHPGAWDPLYAVVSKYPGLRFLVIVNPNSGPGYAPWWPNEDYVREVPKLNAYANVRTVGYVRADYCKRSVNDVEKDVFTYASRPITGKDDQLAIEGIFVDEVVNLYSDQAIQYLGRVDKYARQAEGIRGDRIVIHNPGTAVEQQFAKAEPGPDISVVVETSFGHFDTEDYQVWLANSPYDRSRTCYMMHSVPEEKVAELAVSLRDKAKYIFLTSATSNFYESFAPSWKTFIEAMAEES